MASVKSGTLVGGVATALTIEPGTKGFKVTNTAQSGIIYVAVSDVGTATVATVAGDDCYVVLGDREFDVVGDSVAVSLISSGTPTYSVEAVDA